MRRLSVLVVSAVFALGISAQASAGTVTSASLSLAVGSLPPVVLNDVVPDVGVGTDTFVLPFTATETKVSLPTAMLSDQWAWRRLLIFSASAFTHSK